MKNIFNILLTALLLVVSCLLVVINIKVFTKLSIIVGIVAFVGLFVLYKVESWGKKKKHIFLSSLVVLNIAIQIFLGFKGILTSVLSSGVYLLSLLLLFYIVKRETDLKTGFFALIVGTIACPLLINNLNANLICLAILVFSYCLNFDNYKYPLGKRKLLRYIVIGMVAGLLIKIHLLFIIPLALFAITIARNVKVKEAIKILFVLLFFGGLVYYGIKVFDLSNAVNVYENYSSVNHWLNVVFAVILLIYNLYFSLSISICEGYDNKKMNLNIFYFTFLIILFVLDRKYEIQFSNISLYLLIVSFALNSYCYRYRPRVKFLDRFKKDEPKKVSVVIPNYNYGAFLDKRIDSVINQTYPIHELIILDDASTDDSMSIIKEKVEMIKEEYPSLKCRVIENKENSGNVFKQWQKAFEESTGDYLWIAEADDYCSKYFLNSTMKGFNDPKVVLSYCESKFIDENGKKIASNSRSYSEFFNDNRYIRNYTNDGKKEIAEILFINNSIVNASGVIFKKDKSIDVDSYFKEAQKFRLCGDWYFYYKYLLNGSIYYNCDALNSHRLHDSSVTLSIDKVLKLDEIMEVQSSIEKDVEISEEMRKCKEEYIANMKKQTGMVENVIRFNFKNYEKPYKMPLKKRIASHFHKKVKGTVDIYKSNYSKISADKKVSVVIPNYNYENYIIERIDSVVRQTYPIYELIILDDCSTDNSVKVINEKIESLKDEYPDLKVSFVPNKENSGCVFEQWQKAFQLSKGDYLWIAEADDSANPKFLENVMKAFDDPEVALSYAESMRIDENNNIIANDCREWMTAVSFDRWDKSFIKDGIDEIKESLSICNTIPNVSAVVFKKGNQIEMLENCKRFRISGDWYLYYQILKEGKISYCAKSLNYFRKHSASTSTVAKKELELEELLIIQTEIRKDMPLTSQEIANQRRRYENIYDSVDEETKKKVDKYIAKRIAWIIPFPIKGSGGIRTMIQNANYLVSIGYEVDIYVEEDGYTTDKELHKLLSEFYGECLGNAYIGVELRKPYDLVFATYSILTADYVSIMEVPKKAYFIQDFEPWFEAMSELYLQMERTYKYKLEGISIGNWLSNKINKEFGAPMHSFNFCADLNVYKKIDDIEKEDAICFIYQPEKSRRCSNLGLKALQLVKRIKPNIKIYLYGSDTGDMSHLGFTNLGIMKLDKCNELYNKCRVGLCISASNPSRIPFEMMAAGLPVVDIYRENNLYDDPEGGVLLADSTPEGMAAALIKILDDAELQRKMSKFGIEFMKNYPLEKGFEQFGQFVEDYLNDKLDDSEKHEKIYNAGPCEIGEDVKKYVSLVTPMPVPKDESSELRKFLRKSRKKVRDTINEIIRKVFKVY